MGSLSEGVLRSHDLDSLVDHRWNAPTQAYAGLRMGGTWRGPDRRRGEETMHRRPARLPSGMRDTTMNRAINLESPMWINRRRAAQVRHALTALFVTTPCVLSGCLAMTLATRGAPESGIQDLVLELAPIDLPAGGEGHHGPQPPPLQTRFTVSGWMHGFSVEVVDADGAPVPLEVLHHLKVMAPDRRELFSSQMLRLVGAGSETGEVSLPTEIGYRFERGDSVIVTAMLHNPTGVDYSGVRTRIHMSYSPSGPWNEPLSVMPFFVHVTAPEEHSAYDLPPGDSQRSIDVRPAIGGRILALSGHLHRYGRSIRLEDVTTGKEVWSVDAVQEADGTISEISHDTFVWSRSMELDPTHTYRVVATYHNPTGQTIPEGGMGTLGGILIPDADWPTVDRHDTLYMLDRDREVPMTHHTGGG